MVAMVEVTGEGGGYGGEGGGRDAGGEGEGPVEAMASGALRTEGSSMWLWPATPSKVRHCLKTTPNSH